MPILNEDQVEIVNEVIWLFRKARAERKVKTPEKGFFTMSDMLTADILPKTGERVLERFIDNLPKEDRAMLMAVMILGRWDSGQTADDYPGILKHARGNTDHMGDYLGGKPLSKYLRAGLIALGVDEP